VVRTTWYVNKGAARFDFAKLENAERSLYARMADDALPGGAHSKDMLPQLSKAAKEMLRNCPDRKQTTKRKLLASMAGPEGTRQDPCTELQNSARLTCLPAGHCRFEEKAGKSC
jgi:hypothetical protein